jgi:hypothetical protein
VTASLLLRYAPHIVGATLLVVLGAVALNWGMAPRRALAECRQHLAEHAQACARNVAHAREALLVQSAHIERLQSEAQARTAAAGTRALRALAQPIPPPTGHGPEEMNQWIEQLE